jgi:uncharacterized protein (TIGR00730 family)
MRRLCVFCGSSFGLNPEYLRAAQDLGKILVQAKIELVYGGGHVGLMGAIADSVLEAGGKAIGVIPEFLAAKELAHNGLTELKIVRSMHERKSLMAELSDGFIALPGGFGTLEEFCEVLSWSSLGFHKKPCGLLNVAGYYDELIKFFDTSKENQFVSESHRDLILVSSDPKQLVHRMQTYKHTAQEKWLNKARL